MNKSGRYIKIYFDSFSAAKKTLETFIEEQWFGLNKYWLDVDNNLVAECYDGQSDFQIGVVMCRGNIFKYRGFEVPTKKINFYLPNFRRYLRI